MYAEVCRTEWQHTASICAQLVAVNSSNKHQKIRPVDFNPWESKGNENTKSFKLSEPGNFQQMRHLAGGRQT